MKKQIIFISFILIACSALYATPDFSGTWLANVYPNGSLNTYEISFFANNRCTIKITNNNAKQETSGIWSWDGSLFRLHATFTNASLSYIPNISWSSVLDFADDNKSFTILGRLVSNGPQTRITFFRQDSYNEVFNEKVIPEIFNIIYKNIPLRSRLAIVGITASNPNEADFYVNELTLKFVNARNYTVVERSNIDAVFAEQNFQLSGYVDDDAIVSIGKFIGATVVITGSISGTGSQKRMIIKAIDVLTSEILSMASVYL